MRTALLQVAPSNVNGLKLATTQLGNQALESQSSALFFFEGDRPITSPVLGEGTGRFVGDVVWKSSEILSSS